MTPTLNLDPESALLRGIERADSKLVEQFISMIREMREPVRYANQDVDRRMHARSYLNELRNVGNTPLTGERAHPASRPDPATALRDLLADIDDMKEIPAGISGAALCNARQAVA